MRDRWAGWGRGRRGKHFYYVRKPDPREELTRQGYFVNTGQFVYMRRYPVKIKSSTEKRIRQQHGHSVYEITELRGQQACSGSSVNIMAKRRNIILTSSGEICNANAVMGIQSLPMVH